MSENTSKSAISHILFQFSERGPFSPSFHGATELIGKRWNGAIIYSLFHGLTRFSELKGAIPGLSARMLSERLKELEANGLVKRMVMPETPVRVEYHLSEKGLALRDVLIAIDRWAQQWHTIEPTNKQSE